MSSHVRNATPIDSGQPRRTAHQEVVMSSHVRNATPIDSGQPRRTAQQEVVMSSHVRNATPIDSGQPRRTAQQEVVMSSDGTSWRWRAIARTGALTALVIGVIAALGSAAGPAHAAPIGQCDGPCPTTTPPPRDCHIDTTHYPPRYYGCPMVTVEQSTYAYSTPYLNARVRHPLRRSAYVALCEALGARASHYQNPWWSRLRDGYWVNNGYLRGGHTRKMGIGDCAAPPNDVPTLPRLYTQTQIRSGTTPYGKCAGTAGHVSCRGVQLTNLQLPGTFDVPSGQRRVKVNVKAAEAFRQVVVAVDRAGLGSRIRQFQTWNERGCRYRTGGWIRGCVSMHSYGVAIDINPGIPNATEDGQPLAPVRKIFLAHGFVWGHTFQGNDDPPHFQYAKLR